MPVGAIEFPDMPIIKGIQLNAINAGIKKNGRHDLVLIALPDHANVTGVFTQNAFCAAPVTVCKNHLAHTPKSKYLLINSGNANACTGEQGMHAALACCEAIAQQGLVNTEQVLPFSTGVVGEPLDEQIIINALPSLLAGLQEQHWLLAAQGIMTTDTLPKGASHSFKYQGETIVVNGFAKGAGMINPNMATMLGFVATNASISQSLLEQLSRLAANQSFNRITIDGDTSTNDSCLLIATNECSTVITDDQHELYRLLETALIKVYHTLAQSIVRDGEGATKFVTIHVEQGANNNECLQVAYAIAHSPLVKTALFASDPNWGRIVVAIGYAGVEGLDDKRVSVYINDVLIVEKGGRAASYTEALGQQAMNESEITLRIELGRGESKETLWTTDLSHEYVTINAEYRT